MLFYEAHRGERACCNCRRQRIREELRSRSLCEIIGECCLAGDEPTGRTTERLTKRGCDDVDLAEHPVVFGRSPTALAEHSRRMRIVDQHNGVVCARELHDV